jgi:hypothetical protein
MTGNIELLNARNKINFTTEYIPRGKVVEISVKEAAAAAENDEKI